MSKINRVIEGAGSSAGAVSSLGGGGGSAEASGLSSAPSFATVMSRQGPSGPVTSFAGCHNCAEIQSNAVPYLFKPDWADFSLDGTYTSHGEDEFLSHLNKEYRFGMNSCVTNLALVNCIGGRWVDGMPSCARFMVGALRPGYGELGRPNIDMTLRRSNRSYMDWCERCNRVFGLLPRHSGTSGFAQNVSRMEELLHLDINVFIEEPNRLSDPARTPVHSKHAFSNKLRSEFAYFQPDRRLADYKVQFWTPQAVLTVMPHGSPHRSTFTFLVECRATGYESIPDMHRFEIPRGHFRRNIGFTITHTLVLWSTRAFVLSLSRLRKVSRMLCRVPLLCRNHHGIATS